MRAQPAQVALVAAAGLMSILGTQPACSGSEVSGALWSTSDTDTTTDTDTDTDSSEGDTVVDTSDSEDVAPADAVADAAADAAADTTVVPAQWVASSLGDVGVISDVFAVSETEAYAVGGPRVLRWRGLGWATYGEPTGADLYGVWAGDGVVVVVGADGLVATRAAGAPLWEIGDSGVTADLHAVYGRGADDVWAFGDSTTVVHWDGAAWSSEHELDNVDLRAAWIAPGTAGPEGVYAVGTGGQLLSWAAAWKTEQIAVGGAVLHGIYGVDDVLYAVGTEATITVKRAGGWRGQITNDPKDRDLYALSGSSSDDLVVFGEDGAVIVHDGDNWTVQAATGPTYSSADLVATARAGDVWMALGAEGGGLMRDGLGAWVDMETRPERGVKDIAGLSADDLFAVGRGGLFLERGDQGWTAVEVATDEDLNAVDVGPDGVVWAVGAAGTVIRVADDDVTFPDTLLPLDLHGVVATDAGVWACGKGGMLLRISADGQTVTVEPSGTPNDLEAVVVGGDGALWLSGAFGTLLRAENGALPTAVSSGVGGALNDMAATADGVMVVGDNGVVLDATAEGVTLRHEDPGLFLFGAAAGPGGADFAVGWNGAVLRREGGGFVEEVSGVNSVLEAVWSGGAEALAVGRQGTLITRLEAP
ncbi:MAG: hypothetical protein CSA66_03265 [Proteobacteria bacterium]|nr:MAG: hypothetical protein CSA66_03265 [Pseudomonadota bacterium]